MIKLIGSPVSISQSKDEAETLSPGGFESLESRRTPAGGGQLDVPAARQPSTELLEGLIDPVARRRPERSISILPRQLPEQEVEPESKGLLATPER